MSKTKTVPNGFQVGDWVRIMLGARKVRALILEDRGNVGRGGRRLFTVEIPADPAEPMTFELAADDMEPTERDEAELDREKAVQYLSRGGLVSMLRAGLSAGERQQPRVWLRYDTLGNVTHTFHERHGQMGGTTIPPVPIDHERIPRSKLGEIREFLGGFGLSKGEIEKVIRAVGTEP